MNYTFCHVQQQQSHAKLKGPHVTLVVGLLQACKPVAEEAAKEEEWQPKAGRGSLVKT